MKILTGLLALFVLAVAMPMPETGTTPPNAVPFETVRNVALTWAANEFPGAKFGTAIPYVDENGNTVAWMFHFRTDGKAFPDYAQIAADVQAERQTLTMNTDLSRWRSKYSHILVSARRDRAPVIRFGYGTSEYYAIAAKAFARANQTLGLGARLSRIYFVSPSTYLEFTNASGKSTVMSEHFERTWDSREAFTGYVTQARAQIRQQYPGEEVAAAKYESTRWDHVLDSKLGSFGEVFVPNYGLAPFYDWSYGCTPTSGAMVCGYVDRFQNSGRLVDWFYQRYDGVEGENDWQVPNVQYECAVEMYTDTSYGGTSIGYITNGLFQVGYSNGYTAWSVTNVTGRTSNDWAWSTITSQVNAGHAMIWSALWEAHSLACFGYRTEDKFVYVHNTWWAPGEWWAHSGSDVSHVAAVTPDAGDAHNIRMTYPLGDTFYNSTGRGEVLYVGDTVRIAWESGTPGTKVDIDVSTDGGSTWTSAAAGVADSGAYHWYIPPSLPTCDSVRLRLRQYNGSTLTSADGTIGCFHTLREPVPPPQIAPPNGLPIMDPPVALVVDSVKAACDSIHFKLIQGLDTLLEQSGPSAHCALPDTMFVYNKTYKWIVRGYNQWGWGPWSTPWSFRTLFSGIEEVNPVIAAPTFSVPAVNRLASGSVQFDVRAAAPGSKMIVYDALGNVVRELVVVQSSQLTWDMTDAAGRKLVAGLYFARLAGGANQPTSKLVLLD
jgi:hypothetical protein